MKQLTVAQNETVREAIRVIELARKTIAVVVSESGQLLGTVSDGDIRRAIMAGHGLDDSIVEVMNRNPTTALEGSSEEQLARILSDRGLEALPLVDRNNRFIRVVHAQDLGHHDHATSRTFERAVIMAGGLGKRLGRLTRNTPKPMLPVGGMPLIERSIKGMAGAGVKSVYIAVNYLHDRIEDYFGDGTDLGIRIRYLKEEQRLGTAGALSLIDEDLTEPLLVVNGDVLTKCDYGRLYEYHVEGGACMTIGLIQHRIEIPYGVVDMAEDRVIGMREKPAQSFFCNAGIYALSADVLNHLPRNEPIDMTDIIQSLIDRGESVKAFPIHEYWTDIGLPADLERARKDVAEMDNAVSGAD